MSLHTLPGRFDLQVVDHGAQPPASRMFPLYTDTARRTARISLLDDVELSEKVHTLIPGAIGGEAAKLIREFKISGKLFMNMSEDDFSMLIKNKPDIIRSYVYLQGSNSPRNRARRGSIVDAFPQLSPQISSLRDISVPENSLTEDVVSPVKRDMSKFEIPPSGTLQVIAPSSPPPPPPPPPSPPPPPPPRAEPVHLDSLLDVQACDSPGTVDPPWQHSSGGHSQLDPQISGSEMPDIQTPEGLDPATDLLQLGSHAPSVLNRISFLEETPPGSTDVAVVSDYSSERSSEPNGSHVDGASVTSSRSSSAFDPQDTEELVEEVYVGAPVLSSSSRPLSANLGSNDSTSPQHDIMDGEQNMPSHAWARRHSQTISSPGSPGDSPFGGLFLVSSSVPEIRPDIASLQDPDTSIPPSQSGQIFDALDIPIMHTEIFTIVQDGSQDSAINSQLSAEGSEDQTSLNTSGILKVNDGVVPTADAVSLPPSELGLRDGSNADRISLTSAVASSQASFSPEECKSDPAAGEDAEYERSVSPSVNDDGIDFASPMRSLDDIAGAVTSSRPSMEMQPEWTLRDLFIVGNDFDRRVLPEELDNEKSTVESITNNVDISPTMLHMISYPGAETSILSRPSVVPIPSDITHDMSSGTVPSDQEIEGDSVIDGHESYGSLSPCLVPLHRLPSLPSLLSSIDWLPPAIDSEQLHDGDTMTGPTRSEFQETCLGLTTESQLPDSRSGQDVFVNDIVIFEIDEPNLSSNDTVHTIDRPSNAGKVDERNDTLLSTEHIAASPFLEVEVPGCQLIAELSALSPYFSPLEISELSRSNGNTTVEPKSLPIQPQLLRAATSSPPRSAIACTPRTLWPTTSGHHENTTPTPSPDTRRPVSHPRPAIKPSDRDPQDSKDLNQRRRLDKRDRTGEPRTPLKNSQHSAATEVRSKSWWDVLFRLFSTSGEFTARSGSQQLRPELQIDTDRLLVPVCEGPMSALTEP